MICLLAMQQIMPKIFVMMDPQTKTIVHSRDVLWLNQIYFQSWGTPGAPVMVKGLSMPADEGSVVSDSDESNSSAGKNKQKKIGNLSDLTNSDSSDSNSVDSYDSNESYRSTDMDYTQQDGTQLDPYQQGPLEQEHEMGLGPLEVEHNILLRELSWRH